MTRHPVRRVLVLGLSTVMFGLVPFVLLGGASTAHASSAVRLASPNTVASGAVASDATAAEQQLADKYVPIAELKTQTSECDSSGEQYLPAPVDVVFNDPQVALRERVNGGSSSTDPVIMRAPAAADLHDLGANYYLDLPGNPRDPGCGYAKWFRTRMAGYAPTTYAHVLTDDGKLVLQYWFYYVFNDFNNKHESDWEMMQLVFDAPTAQQALATAPSSMILAQHGGGETAKWTDKKVQKDGDHPIVYPSAGSHATQYSNGVFVGWGENGTGFGCDTTTAPSTRVPLTAVLLPDGAVGASSPFAWLTYKGSWGELSGGEYDGPTGPADKTQWTSPIAWQARQRSSSLDVSGASAAFGPGPTTVFCHVSAFGSTLFTRLGTDPNGVYAVVAAVIAATAGLFFISRKTIGEALVLYRRHWKAFIVIGLVLIPVGLVFNEFQYLVRSVPPGEQLFGVLNDQNHDGNFAAALIVGVGQHIVGIVIVGPAVIEAFRRIELGERLDVVAIYREAFRRFPDTAKAVLLATVIVAPLTLVVVGVPIAVWLLVRWIFTPQAVMLDGQRGRAALKRSATAAGKFSHWLRTAGSSLLLFLIGAAPGPIVGLGFLIFRSSSVEFANGVSSFIFAAFLPFSFLGYTVLYRNRQKRQSELAHPTTFGEPSTREPGSTAREPA